MLNQLNKLLGCLAIAGAVTLAGCAQNEKIAAEDQPAAVEAELKIPESASQAPMDEMDEPVLVAQPDYLTVNPVPITFEQLSVTLTDSDKQILEQINDRVLAAKRLTIRGYCDRDQVGNAKEAAIERGVAVRNELVRLGVNPNAIRIRYSTEVADKHAAEIELHPAS